MIITGWAFIIFLVCATRAAADFGNYAFAARLDRKELVFEPQTVLFKPFLEYRIDGSYPYDQSQGRYNCPVRGVYTFSVKISMYDGNALEFELAKNEKPIVAFAAFPSVSGGGTVDVFCNKGEYVCVKIVKVGSGPNRLRPDFSWFSGHLLREL